MTDPRSAGEVLHRAAGTLRSATRDAARGPWRWAEPDPDVGADLDAHVDRPPGRPTSPKYVGVIDPGPVRRFARPSVLDGHSGPTTGPPVADVHPAAAHHAGIATEVAEPLADLLDALGNGVAAAIDAGGSLHEEPYRSALATAAAVLAAHHGAGTGGA